MLGMPMVKVLFKIYAFMAVIFGSGMFFFMIKGPVGMSKLFAIGVLWCMVGMFVNSNYFFKLTERVNKSWEKRE